MKLTTEVCAQFVPHGVHAFLDRGRGARIMGHIKELPEEFRVEERAARDLLCTVGRGNDLPAGVASTKGTCIAVTLVKRGLSTFDAIDQLAQKLRVPVENISLSGLKDSIAVTAQRLVITGVTFDEVARLCLFEPLNGKIGWFIKDPAAVDDQLSRGHLIGNQFTIRVRLDGLSKSEIESYLKPRLERLAANGMHFPNAYGPQRLGRRRIAASLGQTMIEEGIEAAVKRFWFEHSDSESSAVTAIRKKLSELFAQAELTAQTGAGTVWQQTETLRQMLTVLEGDNPERAHYSDLGLSVEAQLLKKVCDSGDVHQAVSALRETCAIWVAAYQSFWFNQVLGQVVRGELKLPCNNPLSPEIPLLQEHKDSLAFYRQYCPEAVPSRIDPAVALLFLQPQPQGSTSWRPLYATVKNLNHTAEDGAWTARFSLPAGAYATTFLGMLFDLPSTPEIDA